METSEPKSKIQVIGVMSSAKLNGNTAILVREALRGAEEDGAEISELLLPKYQINFCQGCLGCMVKGRCWMDDDFEQVKALIQAANGIILSSPTYGGAPCARMKNLLDRFGLFERFTSTTFGGKYIVGISTASSAGDARKVARGLASLMTSLVYERGYSTGFLGVCSSPNGVEHDIAALRKARALGRKLVRDIRSGRRYPFQNPVSQLMNRLILKPSYTKAILDYREGPVKAVYENLRQRGILVQP
ncbi:MAG: flavodoxin family protein [Omnitrophica WOR_2 bacterium]